MNEEQFKKLMSVLGDASINVDSLKAYIDATLKELKRVKGENQSFRNVLATIHRDGGHYVGRYGHKKASKDAIKILTELKHRMDVLECYAANTIWEANPKLAEELGMEPPKYTDATNNEESVDLCSCGELGTPRFDNELPCGTHCDECFDKLVKDCRKRSY